MDARTERGGAARAVEAMSDEARVDVDVSGRRLSVSNLKKVLYPKTGFTKADLLSYYHRIAPVMLPHLVGRPVTVLRFPDGVEAGGFFAKNVPKGAPEWLDRIVVQSSQRGRSESTEYPIVRDDAGLIYLVNLAAVEFHVPMWRVPLSEEGPMPDELVFDLDPGAPADIVQCSVVALGLRSQLAKEKLQPVVKTSGRKGLQLYCPIKPVLAETARERALAIAEEFVADHAELAVSNMRKDLRRGKVLIDWSQNVPAKTTVAPYSLRSETQPSVSTPLRWEEVQAVADGDDPASIRFSPEAVIARVESEGDLFAPLLLKR